MNILHKKQARKEKETVAPHSFHKEIDSRQQWQLRQDRYWESVFQCIVPWIRSALIQVLHNLPFKKRAWFCVDQVSTCWYQHSGDAKMRIVHSDSGATLNIQYGGYSEDWVFFMDHSRVVKDISASYPGMFTYTPTHFIIFEYVGGADLLWAWLNRNVGTSSTLVAVLWLWYFNPVWSGTKDFL